MNENNILNPYFSVPFLRTSREFPTDASKLTLQISKMYIDVAESVNLRTIGIFPINRPVITGETWYIANIRQQSSRQCYNFSAIVSGGTLSIPDYVTNFTQFTKISGTCMTDFPDSRPIPYVGTSANDYISLRRDTNTNSIVISVGSGSPNIISGVIILEWINNV
jgi:hypothetical protein